MIFLVVILAILCVVTGDSKKVDAASMNREQTMEQGYVLEGEDTIILDSRKFDETSITLTKCKKVKHIIIDQTSKWLEGRNLSCFENAITITIPSNIIDIDTEVVKNLPNLTQFIVDEKNPKYSSIDGVLYNKAKTELIYYPHGANPDVKVEKGTLVIGSYAFNQAPIQSITFEEGLGAIKEYAFAETKLTSISLPASFRVIQDKAFIDSSLTTIEISSANQSLCSVDGAVYDKNKTYLYYWPEAKKEEILKFPETLKYIDCSKINNFSSTTTISIPANLTAIVNTQDNQIERILVDTNHKYFKLYDGVLYSYDYQRIRLYPNKNKDIEITLHKDLSDLDMDLFRTENTTKVLILPTNLKELKGERKSDAILLSGFTHLQELKFSSTSKNFKLVDGVLYNSDQTKVLWYPIDLPQKNYVIPESVTLIDNDQLVIQNNLEKITVPKNCKLYDLDELNKSEYTFFYADLIGSECPELEEFIIAYDNPYYCFVEGVLFSKDMKKLILYPAQKKDQSYSVPEGVEEACFLNKNDYLVTLNLPKSMRSFNRIGLSDSPGYIFGDSLLRYSALSQINVNEENEVLQSIDGVLFFYDYEWWLLTYPMGKQSSMFELPQKTDVITNMKYFMKHPYLKVLYINPTSEHFKIHDGQLRQIHEIVEDYNLGGIELKYTNN